MISEKGTSIHYYNNDNSHNKELSSCSSDTIFSVTPLENRSLPVVTLSKILPRFVNSSELNSYIDTYIIYRLVSNTFIIDNIFILQYSCMKY